MTLDQFGALLCQRIPTADEFVAFVESQGWKINVNPDNVATLRGRGCKDNLVAVKLARLLGREPYRTKVLNVAMLRWRSEDVPVATPEPPKAPETSATRPPREWVWKYGQTYTEDPADRQFGNQEFHVAGAWFWRYTEEAEWRPVPGRGGMNMIRVDLPKGGTP